MRLITNTNSPGSGVSHCRFAAGATRRHANTMDQGLGVGAKAKPAKPRETKSTRRWCDPRCPLRSEARRPRSRPRCPLRAHQRPRRKRRARTWSSSRLWQPSPPSRKRPLREPLPPRRRSGRPRQRRQRRPRRPRPRQRRAGRARRTRSSIRAAARAGCGSVRSSARAGGRRAASARCSRSSWCLVLPAPSARRAPWRSGRSWAHARPRL